MLKKAIIGAHDKCLLYKLMNRFNIDLMLPRYNFSNLKQLDIKMFSKHELSANSVRDIDINDIIDFYSYLRQCVVVYIKSKDSAEIKKAYNYRNIADTLLKICQSILLGNVKEYTTQISFLKTRLGGLKKLPGLEEIFKQTAERVEKIDANNLIDLINEQRDYDFISLLKERDETAIFQVESNKGQAIYPIKKKQKSINQNIDKTNPKDDIINPDKVEDTKTENFPSAFKNHTLEDSNVEPLNKNLFDQLEEVIVQVKELQNIANIFQKEVEDCEFESAEKSLLIFVNQYNAFLATNFLEIEKKSVEKEVLGIIDNILQKIYQQFIKLNKDYDVINLEPCMQLATNAFRMLGYQKPHKHYYFEIISCQINFYIKSSTSSSNQTQYMSNAIYLYRSVMAEIIDAFNKMKDVELISKYINPLLVTLIQTTEKMHLPKTITLREMLIKIELKQLLSELYKNISANLSLEDKSIIVQPAWDILSLLILDRAFYIDILAKQGTLSASKTIYKQWFCILTSIEDCDKKTDQMHECAAKAYNFIVNYQPFENIDDKIPSSEEYFDIFVDQHANTNVIIDDHILQNVAALFDLEKLYKFSRLSFAEKNYLLAKAQIASLFESLQKYENDGLIIPSDLKGKYDLFAQEINRHVALIGVNVNSHFASTGSLNSNHKRSLQDDQFVEKKNNETVDSNEANKQDKRFKK